MVKHIHRGEVLNAVVKRSGLKVSDVTKRAGYSRASFYNHISIPDLSYDILDVYGRVLNYDFSEEFPEMIKYVAFMEPTVEYGNSDQLRKEINRWKDKYFVLLEKYNILIEEKLQQQLRGKTGDE